jgi:type II secretory pathway component GspD/PulD (secretin)
MRRPILALLLLASVSLASAARAAEGKKPSVTLDVKDEDARVILKSMQQQCGIKNLVLDPDVKGSGTFYFNAVPCPTAFRVVLRTMGLQASTYSNQIVTVGTASH